MKTTTALLALGALAAFSLLAQPARAELVLEVQPSAALSGGTGTFEVDLTDTDSPGSAAYDLGSFSFEVTVPSTGITFTDAEMDTSAPYIFAGNSFDEQNGFTLGISSLPTTDLTAGDDAASGATVVNSGDTYGLGVISYSIAPGTPTGPVDVSFNDSGTSLSDDASPTPNSLSNRTDDGNITVINASAAPEPSQSGMLGMMALGLGGLLICARRIAARRKDDDMMMDHK